ncbi:MAG: nitroreductase family protein [Bacteroidia bacterium]|nr:nitroreductase family protein [Bacteroidia bacterium]MBT8278325.1 nitroreductase family protein [Bacteroidia bacterium]NND26131.1 nitroreductase family protein [Flavobacteriaceae bacterium]NNK60072.1 nitroreductase family protein [Flavobacteriaceae bacterium]NNL34114.1 nitroreductase family protein [Flavobacteriaceae bacterium]
MEKTVSDAIAYRRSVRIYKDEPIAIEKVKSCLKNAVLAPTSSNLQLWEFYHISNKKVLQDLAAACFDQNAAKTAQQLVVIVVRKDLWRQRAKANLNFLKKAFDRPDLEPRLLKRKKIVLNYYDKLIPFTYFDFLGIFGMLKYLMFQIVGLFRPIYRQARRSDMRIVAHKSAGLAAQNFMISMAAIGYDTCPMEGSDTLRVKRILKIPNSAEINMVIGCGIRSEKGVYGPRFRVPFEETYKAVT